MEQRCDIRLRSVYSIVGVVLLLCGYFLYLFYRGPNGTVLHSWPLSQAIARIAPYSGEQAAWTDWMPSFLYVLAFSLLTVGMLGDGGRRWYAVPILWMMLASTFEMGQYFHISIAAGIPRSWAGDFPLRALDDFFRFGTFDPSDLAAGIGGMLVAVIAAALMRGEIPAVANEGRPILRHLQKAGGFAVVLFGITCLLATSQYVPCEPTADPVYMSYDDLRKPVAAADPEALSQAGKIYVYSNLILFNRPNRGIHVIDNTDPRSPQNLLFLPIPGNIDIAVKDDVLYADSYIDLVTIDIRNINDMREVKRIQGVFPYDPYQNIPDWSVRFCSYDADKGVIVDYTRR